MSFYPQNVLRPQAEQFPIFFLFLCSQSWFPTLFLSYYLLKTSFIFFKILFIYLFLDRGERREKERERNIDQLPLVLTPTRG